ncbi:MAG: hypothetical protein ACRDT2_10280 [Natronosporangium sp.]
MSIEVGLSAAGAGSAPLERPQARPDREQSIMEFLTRHADDTPANSMINAQAAGYSPEK